MAKIRKSIRMEQKWGKRVEGKTRSDYLLLRIHDQTLLSCLNSNGAQSGVRCQ